MTAPDVRAQAADLIDNAIEILHERGWCQESFYSNGHVCLETALGLAWGKARGRVWRPGLLPCDYEPTPFWTAYRTLGQAVGIDGRWFLATKFNDNAESVEDVLLVMKQAAASLREPQP